MNEIRKYTNLFGRIFPLFSALIFIVSYAVIFDTFNLTIEATIFNIVLALPIFGICLIIHLRYHIATIISVAAAFLLYYMDQYVFSSRLTHIRFSDLKLIPQAVRVAGRYTLPWNTEIAKRLLIVSLLCALLVFIYRFFNLNYEKKCIFFSGLVIFASSSIAIMSGIIPSVSEEFDFSSDTETKGILYSWYCQAKESHLEAPIGYSKDEAMSILAKYENIAGDDDVNILVIMNESLTDYSLLGEPRFEDPLPFIHQLVESGEAFEGNLLVSVFGGQTATTEYEFLTGNSAAFLPSGASPYLQYVNGVTENLTSELKSNGYNTIAIHPYFSEEWNRSQVYSFFGFEQFISGADFGTGVDFNGSSATSQISENLISFGDGPLYVRGLISDRTGYEKVLGYTTDQSFIFNVTMQNHGGYKYMEDDFTNKEYVTQNERKEWTGKRTLYNTLYNVNAEDVESEVHDVNQYLSCINLSDQAFEYLIGEVRKSKKKTFVLMFGDHQPGLLISEHYVDLDDNVDPDFTVPYLLWTNYNTEFDAPKTISPNYLSAVLKKNAGLSLTAWDQFRLEIMEKYPVITTNYVIDRDGNNISKDILKNYKMIQYMRMFE